MKMHELIEMHTAATQDNYHWKKCDKCGCEMFAGFASEPVMKIRRCENCVSERTRKRREREHAEKLRREGVK